MVDRGVVVRGSQEDFGCSIPSNSTRRIRIRKKRKQERGKSRKIERRNGRKREERKVRRKREEMELRRRGSRKDGSKVKQSK